VHAEPAPISVPLVRAGSDGLNAYTPSETTAYALGRRMNHMFLALTITGRMRSICSRAEPTRTGNEPDRLPGRAIAARTARIRNEIGRTPRASSTENTPRPSSRLADHDDCPRSGTVVD
jgi:hypothetical protein